MRTATPPLRTTALALAALLLAACGAPTADDAPTAAAGAALTVTDPWVKASDAGMTGAFGVLENAGPDDVTVVAATSPAAATVELHETVADDSGHKVMQPKEGGFVVPAGGSLELAPGGNHLMLMGLTGPLVAGDDVTVTLELADGSTVGVVAVAKDFTGAQEDYSGAEGTDHDAGMGD